MTEATNQYEEFDRSPLFLFMSNSKNPQFSNKMLETARDTMDILIEGASELQRATAFLARLHEEREFPINIQTMSEISQMMLSMRKMLYEQKAELELKLASIDDEKAISNMLVRMEGIIDQAGRAEV